MMVTKPENMVGVIYAGGFGTRLAPYTGNYDEAGVFHPARNKQALPLGELGTPMFGYPLAFMMRMGIRDILIPVFDTALEAINSYYGDGSQLGINITYAVTAPGVWTPVRHLFDANEAGYIRGKNVCVMCGDSFVHPGEGNNFSQLLRRVTAFERGALIVSVNAGEQNVDPRQYGVITRNDRGEVTGFDEKPSCPASNEIDIGVNIYDNTLSGKLDKSGPGVELRELYARENTLDAFCLRNIRFIDSGSGKRYVSNYRYVREQMAGNNPVETPERVAHDLGICPAPRPPSARLINREGRVLGPLAQFAPISTL